MSTRDGTGTGTGDRGQRSFSDVGRRIRRVVPLRVGIALAVVTGLAAATGLAFAAGAIVVPATLPVLPSSTQFDVTGFLQEATLDQACVTAAGAGLDAQGNPQVAHCGGTMKLNGQTIVVPSETIAILPASALTWQELFAQSPAPYTGVATGMALADNPKPYTSYEFHVVGNRVIDPTNSDPAKRDRYIAGLVHISQQDLNAGAGYINFMDYSTGEMRVGGVPGDSTTGARVRINDPANPTSGSGGRYGRAMSPDGRFMVDQDNPTIASATGFPMCFPRTDPFVTADALCPQTNRPLNPTTGAPLTLFTMNNPATIAVGGPSDPRLQAPFEVGDYVNYSGTLIADPLPGDSGSAYISAHTIIANVAIYTSPGTNPAYVSIEVGLMGTGGLTVIGATEAVNRTRFEGMTTDPSRGIHLYGVDVHPDGSTTDRDWGTIAPDVFGGAVPGRWRFRPPCNVFGSGVPAKPIKDCVYGPDNGFLPPTREVRAVIEGLHSQIPGPTASTSANGIYYGQYHAPIGEYIFPENVPGQPIPENNFNTIPFLTPGGYSSFTGVVAGQLDPWPSNIVPAAPCVAPVANAGGPYTVASGRNRDTGRHQFGDDTHVHVDATRRTVGEPVEREHPQPGLHGTCRLGGEGGQRVGHSNERLRHQHLGHHDDHGQPRVGSGRQPDRGPNGVQRKPWGPRIVRRHRDRPQRSDVSAAHLDRDADRHAGAAQPGDQRQRTHWRECDLHGSVERRGTAEGGDADDHGEEPSAVDLGAGDDDGHDQPALRRGSTRRQRRWPVHGQRRRHGDPGRERYGHLAVDVPMGRTGEGNLVGSEHCHSGLHSALGCHGDGRDRAADRHPEDRRSDDDLDGDRADHDQRRQAFRRSVRSLLSRRLPGRSARRSTSPGPIRTFRRSCH